MLSLDRWHEVVEVMRRHRLRTFLTALSVAWGIFMLVLLLGAGNGLQTAVQSRFADDATNSLWLYRGKTSMPHEGHRPGRRIQFHDVDYETVRDAIGAAEHVTARFYPPGDSTVRYGDEHSSFDIRAVHPDHKHLERTQITRGRFINELDLEKRRKVAVIGDEVVRMLFGDTDPLGEHIIVRDISYQVVGVFHDEGREDERRKIYLPITTAQAAYSAGDRIHQIMFTVRDPDVRASQRLESEVRRMFAARHDFDPKDHRALRVRNNVERFERIMQIFTWIELFVWIVGIGTIVAGIVGVSNIMLISVKERTREFGVRKAVGATPGSIVAMVLQESVLLTAMAGYCGLVVGVGVLELLGKIIPDNDFFANPEVDLGVAVTATLILVVSGAVAGFFPARRAARVNPIAALREE